MNKPLKFILLFNLALLSLSIPCDPAIISLARQQITDFFEYAKESDPIMGFNERWDCIKRDDLNWIDRIKRKGCQDVQFFRQKTKNFEVTIDLENPTCSVNYKDDPSIMEVRFANTTINIDFDVIAIARTFTFATNNGDAELNIRVRSYYFISIIFC